MFLLVLHRFYCLLFHLIDLLVHQILRRRETFKQCFEIRGRLGHRGAPRSLTGECGYLVLDDFFDGPALVTDEVDTLFGKSLPLLLGACDGTDAHVVFVHRHEGDEGLQDIPDGPRWLPVLRVIVREGQADLLLHLESATRCQEHNVGRLEGIAAGQGDNTMVEATLEGGLRGASDREVPLEGL